MKTTPTKRRGRPPKATAPKLINESPDVEPIPTKQIYPTEVPPENALARQIADYILDGLRRDLPIVARIAQADCLHTCEKPETILERAIKQGRLAAAIWTAQNETKEV